MKYGTAIERFLRKVQIGSAEECWPWTAAIYGPSNPYGAFTNDGRTFRAPRFMWAITHGGLGETRQVLHRCDNTLCVNPSHLFLGTQADNVQDMIAKGRGRNQVGFHGRAAVVRFECARCGKRAEKRTKPSRKTPPRFCSAYCCGKAMAPKLARRTE